MVDMKAHEAYYQETESYRGYVLQGAPWGSGVRPFHLLYDLGMREDDDVLDYGCGSLRVGRFLIPYLSRGHYFGIEPSAWAVARGIKYEVGTSLARIRKPEFIYPPFSEFDCRQFDYPGEAKGSRLFDWVLISAILTHVDHSQLFAVLGSAAAVLKPGGSIVASYLPQGPDHADAGWLYPQQAAHYGECIQAALNPSGLVRIDLDVSSDGGRWRDTWFRASKAIE